MLTASPNFTALKMGPHAPTTDTVPPLRTESIAQFRTIGEPPCPCRQGVLLTGRHPEPQKATGSQPQAVFDDLLLMGQQICC